MKKMYSTSNDVIAVVTCVTIKFNGIVLLFKRIDLLDNY